MKITTNVANPYIIFNRRFGHVCSVHFQALMMKDKRKHLQ